MGDCRRRWAGLALGLLVATVALPAGAQERRLQDLASGQVVDDLRPEHLAAVTPERQMCRSMIVQVNDLALELHSSIKSSDRAQLARARKESVLRWPSTRGFCDAAIGRLDDGWPRSILREEFVQVQALWEVLNRAVDGWVEKIPRDEVDLRLARYNDSVGGWASWLEKSSEFWSGSYLSQQAASTCVDDAIRRVRMLGGRVKELQARIGIPDLEEQRSALAQRVAAEGAALVTCAPNSEELRFELEILGRIIRSYQDGLQALGTGNLSGVRAAMEQEQAHASRAERCRLEYAQSQLTADCKVREAP